MSTFASKKIAADYCKQKYDTLVKRFDRYHFLEKRRKQLRKQLKTVRERLNTIDDEQKVLLPELDHSTCKCEQQTCVDCVQKREAKLANAKQKEIYSYYPKSRPSTTK